METLIDGKGVCNTTLQEQCHRKDAINGISTKQQKQNKYKAKLYDVILNQYAIIQFLYYLLHKLVRGLTKIVRGLTKNSKRTYYK